MARTKPNKNALLSDLADHVLAHGLNTASLRPLAAAAGTSDRMLIYHFGSKDQLIAALLEYLAARMAAGLDGAMPPARLATEEELLRKVLQLMRSDAFQPYNRVWLDIIAAAAQGGAAHREAAHQIIRVFLDWIAKRHPAGAQGAPHALTLIEGMLVMDAAGHASIANAAAGLSDDE
jgi:AcrR family transcriptional regulator